MAQISESILQKRIKRFKSMKRGYYSLIVLIIFYIISLLGPLWMNNKALFISFKNNKWDKYDTLFDENGNNVWDDAEGYIDDNNNGIWDEGEKFKDTGNGIYDEGEFYIDGNGIWDEGEKFSDDNNNGVWDKAEPWADLNGNGEFDHKELWNDLNGNGYLDDGDSFSDENGDGLWNDAEEFVDGNGQWDQGEKFKDQGNGIWDDAEEYIDEYHYFFPAFMDFIDFIPGINYPLYEADYFNQNINSIEVNFRLLDKEIDKSDNNNFIIMPLYPYHPHEDLKDELDEVYIDLNNNGTYDLEEPFTDENKDGIWNENFPPTLPDGFNGRHLLGTDNTGRDVFTRLIDGYKISITFAIIVTTLGYIIGIIAGAILGFYGGKIDLFGVRLMEVFSAMPFLFIMMILASFMKPNIILLASLSVFLKGWIGITYFIRGEFYREKAKDYVSAAVSLGATNSQVMFKHILPNALTPIITFAPFSIIADIGTLVSLDFLGYGLRPPTSSWGNLLSQAAENLYNWHMLVFPVIVLTVTIFMITFISEAVREAFDPRVYSRLR